ncbi:IQ-domain 20 [Perilla frutescens var. hirtella]|uniref:IQ-domain 20 n=1 Tax=Perilla frutescens var. hirtella TaxID=608512 RepID=A0AAD4IN65_PERFH|nr:IQ-domain 20 [Perilla frutescens var. hirtella]KAH6760018.1 IQ-domain 20 [Perilla frutescens var. frutescens]KAH6784591.1 IQ-domain 20 [Perilla frutescens var. hirtella]
MGRNKDHLSWRVIRRKLFRSSPSSRHHDGSNAVIILHTNHGKFSQELDSSSHEENAGSDFLSMEDMAAITIQACFRSHLARRAYKALRSLVKLQALVRGVIVRRQARIALDCMHALARLQITVRARQLLLSN